MTVLNESQRGQPKGLALAPSYLANRIATMLDELFDKADDGKDVPNNPFRIGVGLRFDSDVAAEWIQEIIDEVLNQPSVTHKREIR